MRVPAPHDGGFSYSMPIPGGAQIGKLPLGSDTVETHIMIVRDTGITYLATWFDLPRSLDTLGDAAMFGSISNYLSARTQSTEIDGQDIPLANAQHSFWVENAEGYRQGFVLNRMSGRLALLSIGCLSSAFGDHQKAKAARFLSSFEGS